MASSRLLGPLPVSLSRKHEFKLTRLYYTGKPGFRDEVGTRMPIIANARRCPALLSTNPRASANLESAELRCTSAFQVPGLSCFPGLGLLSAKKWVSRLAPFPGDSGVLLVTHLKPGFHVFPISFFPDIFDPPNYPLRLLFDFQKKFRVFWFQGLLVSGFLGFESAGFQDVWVPGFPGSWFSGFKAIPFPWFREGNQSLGVPVQPGPQILASSLGASCPKTRFRGIVNRLYHETGISGSG